MASLENETFIEEGGEGLRGMPSVSLLDTIVGIQAVLIVVGVFVNSLVLYLYGKRGECFTHNIVILSLAVSDLISCCLFIPLSIALEIRRYVTTSNFLCKFYHFTGNLTHYFFLQSALLIALDRFACVCVDHIHATYHRRAFIAIGVVVVVSIGPSTIVALAVEVNRGYCQFNDSIISREFMRVYGNVVMGLIVTVGIVCALMYSAIFGTALHLKYGSKQTVLESSLDNIGDKTSGDTESSLSPTDESMAPGPSENTADEGKQLEQLQKEQISLAGLMFTITLMFYIVLLPILLDYFHHVRNMSVILFHMYQITYVSKFFVYLCLETTFRDEFKELFQSTWSRLGSARWM